MGLFDYVSRGHRKGPAQPKGIRYAYTTGNVEAAIRIQNGEPLPEVGQDIQQKWTPGNEHLWDEYDAESLVDSEERRSQVVNCLLYARVSIFRALREQGKNVQGDDPFRYLADVPDEVQRIQTALPELFPAAFQGVLPPIRPTAIRLPDGIVKESDFPPGSK